MRSTLLVISLTLAALAVQPAAADELEQTRARLYESYGQKLAALAAVCEREQMPEQARLVRSWLPERSPEQIVLFTVSDGADPATLPESPERKLQQWHARFLQLRSEQAAALFELAQQAVAQRRLSLAMMLLTETVRENPDHTQARAALGYERDGDRWLTPYQRERMKRGDIWHDRFGWIAADDLARYEAGLRPQGTRWLDAEEDARLRRHITRGWQVRTDHYLVTTNHSLEEGVRLARRLEDFYQLWRQLFAAYCFEPSELERALEGRAPRRAITRPHSVVYYRSREEYNRELRRDQPRIEMTLGIYFDTKSRAYFFAGEEQYAGTLYHEAAHQLFQETRRTARNVGRQDNFWIIEGIASYLESLTEHDGYYTLGGAEAGRLPAARQRLLGDQFYVPFAELTPLGMHQLQQHNELPKLYSQMAGQATFLMHADEGRWREALVNYLTAVYQGQASQQTLAELTGTSYDELDRQYRAYLQQL